MLEFLRPTWVQNTTENCGILVARGRVKRSLPYILPWVTQKNYRLRLLSQKKTTAERLFSFGSGGGIRTLDPLVNSQLLCH